MNNIFPYQEKCMLGSNHVMTFVQIFVTASYAVG